MRLRAWIVMVLLPVLMVRASTARADEPVPSPGPDPAPAAVLIYQDDAKSTAGAVVLELLVPGLGNIYAEDYQAALITWGLVVGGLAAAIVGLAQVPIDGPDGPGLQAMPGKTNPVAAPLIIGGAAIAIYGRIYGLQNAANAAERYNTALSNSLGLAPFVTGNAGGLTLGGRF